MSVRYRARALADIHDIHEWRARQSEELATKIEAAIFAAADWLADHPKFGTRTDEADILRWPMTDFRFTVFYRIDGDNSEIEILRIMDGRRVRDLRRVPQ